MGLWKEFKTTYKYFENEWYRIKTIDIIQTFIIEWERRWNYKGASSRVKPHRKNMGWSCF
jgi:hypothetical protein